MPTGSHRKNFPSIQPLSSTNRAQQLSCTDTTNWPGSHYISRVGTQQLEHQKDFQNEFSHSSGDMYHYSNILPSSSMISSANFLDSGVNVQLQYAYSSSFIPRGEETRLRNQLPYIPSNINSVQVENPISSSSSLLRSSQLSTRERHRPTDNRRRVQNREAQRAFRKRKEKHISDLEAKLSDITKNYEKLESSHAALNSAYGTLRKLLDHIACDGDESRPQNINEYLLELILLSFDEKVETSTPEIQLLQDRIDSCP